MKQKGDDRKLVYAFLQIPRVYRVRIAREFVELSDEELDLQDGRLNILILTKVRDVGKLEEFRAKVYERANIA